MPQFYDQFSKHERTGVSVLGDPKLGPKRVCSEAGTIITSGVLDLCFSLLQVGVDRTSNQLSHRRTRHLG